MESHRRLSGGSATRLNHLEDVRRVDLDLNFEKTGALTDGSISADVVVPCSRFEGAGGDWQQADPGRYGSRPFPFGDEFSQPPNFNTTRMLLHWSLDSASQSRSKTP